MNDIFGCRNQQWLCYVSVTVAVVIVWTILHDLCQDTPEPEIKNTILYVPENNIWQNASYRHSPPTIIPLDDSLFVLPYSKDNLSSNLTVITAYFNLGRFQKGEGEKYFTTDLYRKWMQVFSKIKNPVIFYLESDEDIEYIIQLRNELDPGPTKIIKIARDNLWSFSFIDKITKVFKSPSYPKYHPNTVIPEYSCVQHAKYEFMHRAILENPYQTRFFSWLDIGYFRDNVNKMDQEPIKPFMLVPPPKLDVKKVGYTQVYHFGQLSAERIFRGNQVWVGGGYFVGEVDAMMKWLQTYMQAVEHFLSYGLANTDQQIIYAMYSNENYGFKPKGHIQIYFGKHGWFHLGYLSKV